MVRSLDQHDYGRKINFYLIQCLLAGFLSTTPTPALPVSKEQQIIPQHIQKGWKNFISNKYYLEQSVCALNRL